MSLDPRDPLHWAAARTVGAASQLLVASLAQASSTQQVAACLSTALQLCSTPGQSGSSASITLPADGEALQQCLQQLEQHAAALGWPALRHIYFEDQFEAWSCAVLTVAAGEWLPKLQGPDKDSLWRLITRTFTDCPAHSALSALMGHLSSVTPHSSSSSTGACITAVAADTAAELLMQRFLAAGSTGLWELLAACDTSSAPQHSCSQHTTSTQQQQQQQQQQAKCAEQLQSAAALLAALPDRLHLLAPVMQQQQQQLPLLQLPPTPAVLNTLVGTCINFVATALAGQEVQHGSAFGSSSSREAAGCERNLLGGGSLPPAAAAAAAPGAVQFAAVLLQKLVTRGHGSATAGVLLSLAVQALAPASSCSSDAVSAAASAGAVGTQLGTMPACQQQQPEQTDSALAPVAAEWHLQALQLVLLVLVLASQQAAASATQKLLLRLLQRATHNSSSGAQHLPQLPQQQAEAAAMALLRPLLQASPQLRSIVLHKVLLGRTLPAATLQLLLRLLAACRPSLLPEAAVVLAQCWCDSSTILHMQVPQQAFLTAALVGCIQQLPRECLDPIAASHDAATAAGASDAAAATGVSAQQAAAAAALGVVLSPYPGPQPGQLLALAPSIVQGVSARLGSPSPAIRLQAMRVGRAFAGQLDPSTPMFEEAGPLDLMPEEQWPGAGAGLGLGLVAAPAPAGAACSVAGGGEQQLTGQQGVALGQAGEPADAADGRQSAATAALQCGGSSKTAEALARLAEASAGPDSDDEDAGGQPAGSAPLHSTAATVNGLGGTASAPAPGAAGAAATGDDGDGDGDANSVAGSEGSASSLVAFDLQEDLAAEQWWGPDGLGPTDSKALGLRTLAAALRKQDDMSGALEALAKVEVLVRAQPDELPVVAPELARSLIHCKVPIWATPPAAPPSQPQQHSSSSSTAPAGSSAWAPAHTPKGLSSSSAEVQRQRALVAVLALSPLTSGDTLIAELYSPNLDQHQRVAILDALAGAAAEMADPRKAPQLALQGPQAAPELLPPPAAVGGRKALPGAAAGAPRQQALPAGANSSSSSANGHAQGGASSGSGTNPSSAAGAAKQQPQAAAPGLVEASSRVWGKVSLQKQAEAAAAVAAGPSPSSSSRTFRNRFAPVAVRWTAALLQQCDVKQQGFDLFGRDSLLLGRLLTVLGSFVEAAAETPAAVPLCAGLLELLKAREVSTHKEAFVRRSALVAASQVVRHLPPARLAGAMVGRQADVQDELLVERLQWLMAWAQQVAASDTDQHCRALAAGCVAWHVELAEGAMAVLEHLPEPEGPSLVAGGSSSRRGGGPAGGGAGAAAGNGAAGAELRMAGIG